MNYWKWFRFEQRHVIGLWPGWHLGRKLALLDGVPVLGNSMLTLDLISS